MLISGISIEYILNFVYEIIATNTLGKRNARLDAIMKRVPGAFTTMHPKKKTKPKRKKTGQELKGTLNSLGICCSYLLEKYIEYC